MGHLKVIWKWMHSCIPCGSIHLKFKLKYSKQQSNEDPIQHVNICNFTLHKELFITPPHMSVIWNKQHDEKRVCPNWVRHCCWPGTPTLYKRGSSRHLAELIGSNSGKCIYWYLLALFWFPKVCFSTKSYHNANCVL